MSGGCDGSLGEREKGREGGRKGRREGIEKARDYWWKGVNGDEKREHTYISQVHSSCSISTLTYKYIHETIGRASQPSRTTGTIFLYGCCHILQCSTYLNKRQLTIS